MPIKDYKFVSPGVQIKEIDQSVLAPTPVQIGPVIVGRFAKGPAMVPTLVSNVNEFRDIFGGTITGQEAVTDVWRQGNHTLAPSYASIAVEAHLDAAVSPATVVRLLGEQHSQLETGGEAGWKVGTPSSAVATNAGAYALVLNVLSNSAGTTLGHFNSSSFVGAVFYVANGGNIILEGSRVTGSTTVSGSGVWVKAQNVSAKEFKAVVYDSSAVSSSVIFSFDINSPKFIRKVFNTNPTLVNSDVASSAFRKTYWLGETFEKFIEEKIGSVPATSHIAAAIVPLTSLGSINPANFQFSSQFAKSGWVFSQHQGTTAEFPTSEEQYLSASNNIIEAQTKKLFRFASIGKGEFEQENYKILINNIQQPKALSKFGTFDVIVAEINSVDSELVYKEVFSNVTLDRSSQDYIARRIGDKFYTWDYTEGTLLEKGEFDNKSSIIRVEMSEGIANGQYGEFLVPFGFFGPPRPKKISVNPSASMTPDIYLYSGSYFGRSATNGVNDAGTIIFNFTGSGVNLTSSIVFPSFPLVSVIGSRVSEETSSFFGIRKGTKNHVNSPNNLFQNDLLRPLGIANTYEPPNSNFEYSHVFTLDDVVATTASVTASWAYGNRKAATSFTAVNGNGTLLTSSVKNLFTNRFAMTLFGGFDGFDVKEVEPLRNSKMTNNSNDTTEKNNYVYNTYKVGIETVEDAERVNMSLLAVPGLTNQLLTQYMVDLCQTRGDSLAVIDLEGDYKPSHENGSSAGSNAYIATRPTEVRTVIDALKLREINSSYGAAYFPWVKMSVTKPQQNPKDVWVPPSVVAVGTFASSEAKSQLWFAPAGFNRGGLREKDTRNKFTAGFKVMNTAINLTSKQRDDLYEVNINPIANFVNEGIVVFGQKTLQITPSALDRINVRRLLIYIKKRISIIASGILFDANVDVTWARFKGQAETLLSTVKSGLGLQDYKIVLDNTTTTDDLIDRNVLYAKIFLKPTRAIEFIAVDFVITRTGASFND